jgi:hypothetical protein
MFEETDGRLLALDRQEESFYRYSIDRAAQIPSSPRRESFLSTIQPGASFAFLPRTQDAAAIVLRREQDFETMSR